MPPTEREQMGAGELARARSAATTCPPMPVPRRCGARAKWLVRHLRVSDLDQAAKTIRLCSWW
jgi:hypothetical protein